MEDLVIIEDQLIYRRNELENKQKFLCILLHTTPIEFDEGWFNFFHLFHQKTFL
jgi:hypothetical protein